MDDFGNYLRKLRNEKSLSIRRASEGIGISHTYLDSLEKGYDPRTKKERKPTPEVLQKISDYYTIDYEHLLFLAGYISKEMYKKQLKLKEEIEVRETMIGEVKENLSPLHEEVNSLRQEYNKLERSLTRSPYDEDGREMLKQVRNSFKNVINKQSGALMIVKNAEEEVNRLKNELYEINQLIAEEKETNNIHGEKKLDNEILLDVKRILSESKETRQEATPEEVRVLAMNQRVPLEGVEYDIEDLLSSKYTIIYKGDTLTREDKRRMLKLIEISFN